VTFSSVVPSTLLKAIESFDSLKMQLIIQLMIPCHQPTLERNALIAKIAVPKKTGSWAWLDLG